MSFTDPNLKLGAPSTTPLNVASSSTASTTNPPSTGILPATTATGSLPSAFTLPMPISSTGAAVATPGLQLKPTVTSATTSAAPTSIVSNFSLGSGLLNQLKGNTSLPINPPSTNLLGAAPGDKKFGLTCTLITTTTQSQQLGTQQTPAVSTTADWNKTTSQASGVTSFLPTQQAPDKQVPSMMTFEELETTVNKLVGKLADNEEEFAKLARELNDWDKAINENYEKLLLLTETVKTMKSAQIKLNYDLDFIAVEHKDFESIIAACEKEVETYTYSHPSRHDVYQKAISVDIQIRRMCEELREVIEHLNDRLRFCESDDPVMQIGRVLNAHMESLKWVDESTTQIYDYINYLSQIQEQMKKSLPAVGN